MDKLERAIMLAYVHFDAPSLTWEQKFGKIFSLEVSEILLKEFGTGNYPPRTNPNASAEDDVKTFMRWLRNQLQVKHARDNNLGPCDQCGAEVHHKMSCYSGKFTKKCK